MGSNALPDDLGSYLSRYSFYNSSDIPSTDLRSLKLSFFFWSTRNKILSDFVKTFSNQSYFFFEFRPKVFFSIHFKRV